MSHLIIYTDLDATLIEHTTQDFTPALPMLKELNRKAIPLILNSSRTVPELLHLRKEMDNRHPFGAENGGAVCTPVAYFSGPQVALDHEIKIDYLGLNYKAILEALQELKDLHDFSYIGTNDFSVPNLAEETNMSLEMAIKAKSRVCSEALLWLDSKESMIHFEGQLAERNLRLIKGGRFYYVISKRADKGGAVSWINFNFAEAHPSDSFFTVGIGDSLNDLPLLKSVDLPVVVKPPRGEALNLEHPKAIYTEQSGPLGWVEGVEKVLERLKL